MEENEKIILKVMLLSILTLLITSFLILFIGVAKVSAASYSGTYDKVAGQQINSESGNSIIVYTGDTGNFHGSTDNWNKLGVFYHTNIQIENGHTYDFTYTVKVNFGPTTTNPCQNWNISSFSIRYPTTLNDMNSNQVTTTSSNVNQASCTTTGSNENFQTAVYQYTGRFTANRNTNILGARFQIYTSYTAYARSVFSNMSLSVVDAGGQYSEITGAIYNSSQDIINANTNNALTFFNDWTDYQTKIMQKVADDITGAINPNSTISGITQAKLDALHSSVGGVDGLQASIEQKEKSRQFVNSLVDGGMIGGVRDSAIGSYYGEGLTSIENAWSVFTDNAEILSITMLILSLGIVKHLANR